MNKYQFWPERAAKIIVILWLVVHVVESFAYIAQFFSKSVASGIYSVVGFFDPFTSILTNFFGLALLVLIISVVSRKWYKKTDTQTTEQEHTIDKLLNKILIICFLLAIPYLILMAVMIAVMPQ